MTGHRVALTRIFGEEIGRCELTHLPRAPIDTAVASAQHRAYEQALREAGCEVVALPPLTEHPDAVFVEDTAVALDEAVILMRPGAASRRGEVESVAATAAAYRPVVRLDAPARIDGGDVLRLGRTLFVGRSERTDTAGVEALQAAVATWDYEVRPIEVRGCLHLKSAATTVDHATVLLNPDWVDAGAFGPVRVILTDPAEPSAANVLRVGDIVLVPAGGPRTRDRLESEGLHCREVDVSELAKAEAGLTCCSLVLDGPVG